MSKFKSQKNTKTNDNINTKKLNKYKSVLSFPNQPSQINQNVNYHIIKNNKNTKNIQTMRVTNKKNENHNKKIELLNPKSDYVFKRILNIFKNYE